jgi:hypothetical protein
VSPIWSTVVEHKFKPGSLLAPDPYANRRLQGFFTIPVQVLGSTLWVVALLLQNDMSRQDELRVTLEITVNHKNVNSALFKVTIHLHKNVTSSWSGSAVPVELRLRKPLEALTQLKLVGHPSWVGDAMCRLPKSCDRVRNRLLLTRRHDTFHKMIVSGLAQPRFR